MSTTLWGINRPDGTPVTRPPEWGSSYWTHDNGQYGYPDRDNRGEESAERGAKELTDRLIRLGVKPEQAQHRVVRIVIETTIDRQIDWPKTSKEKR